MIISNREIENIDQLLETAVNYAKENGIIRIIIFIKNIDNVMKGRLYNQVSHLK